MTLYPFNFNHFINHHNQVSEIFDLDFRENQSGDVQYVRAEDLSIEDLANMR